MATTILNFTTIHTHTVAIVSSVNYSVYFYVHLISPSIFGCHFHTKCLVGGLVSQCSNSLEEIDRRNKMIMRNSVA